MHFRTHGKPEAGAGRTLAVRVPRHDARPRRPGGRPAGVARRARPRRGHHRRLLHRQRAAHEHLARRRHDAVPQREELELGGRLPGAGHGALARTDPGRAPCSTASSATTTGSRRCWPRPASPTSPTSSGRAPTSAARTYKVHLDGHDQLAYLTGDVGREPAAPLLLRLRRRRPHRAALRQLEVRVPRAARARHAEHLGRALRPAAVPQDVQPADRSVRAGRHHVEHLLRLAARPRLACVPAQAYVAQMLQTLAEFPPRQKPASFSLEQVLAEARGGRAERMSAMGGGAVRAGAIGSPCRAARSRWDRTRHYPEEAPAHRVRVNGFAIDPYPVTNERLRRLRRRHGLRDGRRAAARPGGLSRARRRRTSCRARWSSRRRAGPVDLRHLSQWWTWTPGACWRAPGGARQLGQASPDHPVVHVAHEDAVGLRRLGRSPRCPPRRSGSTPPAAGSRAPRSRGGTRRARAARIMANTWDGPDFPWRSTRESGWSGTSPVGLLPTQRVRPLRHGRQRVGVDRRLVDLPPPRRRRQPCCVPGGPARR